MITITPLQSELNKLNASTKKLSEINKQNEMNQLLQTCIKEVEACGIKVESINPMIKINGRLTSAFGRCRNFHSPYALYEHEIEIAKRVVDKSPFEAIKDTMVHEVLHACEGSIGHGETWKKYASIVNAKYGYKIERCSTNEEMGLKDDRNYKYSFICKSCGYEYKRKKKVDPSRYRCGVCKGELYLRENY